MCKPRENVTFTLMLSAGLLVWLSALFSVKDSFYCNACFCTGAITCHIIHNLNPFLISVIALTLYKDMNLFALPYPQVSEKWRKKTGKQI